ncbi:hypothetical protein [Streptomyces sp. NRRL B-24572]|uniref:hypothetical protein n=1 Tax=Streptomyces sp. NRRL B-24572 TaxID=1962156 RepID=UPI000A3804A5|nr:hypothetical protein [Streptomyces sp. NRRL B-24572]
MTEHGVAPALLGTAAVLALLVVRTAVRELREPGSARHEWQFLRERRGLATFLGTASVLSGVSLTIAGPSYLPWVGLAALLVARISSMER